MSGGEGNVNRRGFLGDGLRIVGGVGLVGFGGVWAARKARGDRYLWQIDPDKCTACRNCETHCVLDVSAVKAVQCFLMCGYCDVCTGYYPTNYISLDTGAEDHLCPTNGRQNSQHEQ